VLAIPADLSADKPGKVTLSLPSTLYGEIRRQAAKLGLGKAARRVDLIATLSGDGYTITPSNPLTAPARIGKATVFAWQVQPGPNAKGPLTADVSAALKGAGGAESVPLPALQQTVAAVEAAAAAQSAKDAANSQESDKPAWIIAAAIILLTVIILAAAGRAASNRRAAEQRRRARAAALTGERPASETTTDERP
jgi:hypothetical protein